MLPLVEEQALCPKSQLINKALEYFEEYEDYLIAVGRLNDKNDVAALVEIVSCWSEKIFLEVLKIDLPSQ